MPIGLQSVFDLVFTNRGQIDPNALMNTQASLSTVRGSYQSELASIAVGREVLLLISRYQILERRVKSRSDKSAPVPTKKD